MAKPMIQIDSGYKRDIAPMRVKNKHDAWIWIAYLLLALAVVVEFLEVVV